jgi:hypothetical protein
MALIDKTYNTLKTLYQKMNKGFITPDEFNDACKYVQNKIHREAFEFLNNIKNNANIGRISKNDGDKERMYKDAVRLLVKEATLTYNGTSEAFDLPEDYSLMVGLTYEGGEGGITEVEEMSYSEKFILSNPEVGVDEVYPICFMRSIDVEIIPETITSNVKMSYYREAKYPKWTYNKVDGKPVFDGDKSDFQDFELPDNLFDEILREMAIYLGVQMHQPNVTQVMSQEEDKSEQFKRLN